MPKLTGEQLNYVNNRTNAKRRAEMTKPLYYQLAENRFLVSPAVKRDKWMLAGNPDFKTWLEDVDILVELEKNIAEFKKALDEDEALKTKKLEDLLKLEKIQYILLKAEEGLQSQLKLPEAERKKVDGTKKFESDLQLLRNHFDLRLITRAATSAAPASPSQQELSVQFTRYQPYRTYDFKLQNNSNLVMKYNEEGKRTQNFILPSADKILDKFKNHYPKQGWLASFFVQNALARAADPRPWYLRWFTEAPQKKSEAEQVHYLLNHAKTDPYSNTAKAFVAILNNEVENKDITDIDDVMREAEANALYVFKINSAGEYALIKNVKPLKADSLTRSVSGSLTPSGAALPAAAARSEPDLSISIRGHQQRFGSQNFAVSELVRSARSGLFPPSSGGSSRGQEKLNIDEASSTLSP